MKNTQPPWLNKTLFPFESRWIEIEDETLHYVDEGNGDVILFAHGTPEWCFGYRDLIKGLRSDYRCIAIDMLGFGLSDKNPASNYTCEAHAKRHSIVIEKLNLKNITIVANDFGGGISLSYALTNPENVKSIVLFNTWMWSLKNDPHYSKPSKTINSWPGRMLYLTFNAPVNLIMPQAFGNKKLLTSEIHSHYKKALPKGQRTATYTFARELMNASDWWQSLWEKVHVLQNKPALLFWGMKDKFIPAKELDKWKSKFPKAKVIVFEDAGHFVQEEKPKEMVEEIRNMNAFK
jgi:pimeloyl-ACP methyl ester carboxylesterase